MAEIEMRLLCHSLNCFLDFRTSNNEMSRFIVFLNCSALEKEDNDALPGVLVPEVRFLLDGEDKFEGMGAVVFTL